MPHQPPRFGASAIPRKPWQQPVRLFGDQRKRGRAGQRDRALVLGEEPMCRVCLAAGVVTASAVVDHIKPLSEGGSDERDNKQALCRPCHDAKSAAERAEAARWRRQG